MVIFLLLKIIGYLELVIESRMFMWLYGFDYYYYDIMYKGWLFFILLKFFVEIGLIDFIRIFLCKIVYGNMMK